MLKKITKKQFVKDYGRPNEKAAGDCFDNYLDVINHIDNCFYKYTVIGSRLKEMEQTVKNTYLQAYVTAIANNFIVTRQLFVCGFHFQMEVLLRNQLELVNNFLAITTNDSAFENLTKTWVRGSGDFMPVSPKEKHIAKAIKKIEFQNAAFGKLFLELYESIKEIYEEFSKSVHGNILHITLLTREENDDDYLIYTLGGKKTVLPRTITYLIGTLDYTQLVWQILENRFPRSSDHDVWDVDGLLNLSIQSPNYHTIKDNDSED